MEGEDSCLKCFPLIPRQGKKKLFLLVAINVVVIWFIYKKSNYFSYISQNPIHITSNSVYTPLYNVPIFHIPLLSSKDMTPYYTDVSSNTWCFIQGTNLKESKRHRKCQCLPTWFGLDCGIPSSVWKSKFLQEGKNAGIEIRRRDRPRRIILSIVFDGTFDLLDINIQNSFSVVDIFLIVEEKNHSESALNLFKKGYLSEFQYKIMPVKLHKSALHEEEHERIASLLNELWIIGWNRLSDFRPDDIFVFSDVSSIISKDILLFLKLYDGYPEPFYFSLRPLLFKFSKSLKSSNKNQTLVPFKPSGCTFQFISTICKYSLTKFLGNKCIVNRSQQVLFEKNHWMIKKWDIGREDFPSGWQCNFCCSTECILEHIKKRWWVDKFSASLSLKHATINASVIEQIFKLNSFNGYNITYEKIPHSDLYFAPKVVLDSEKYKYLLN